jgi:hypothetical protein
LPLFERWSSLWVSLPREPEPDPDLASGTLGLPELLLELAVASPPDPCPDRPLEP